MADRKHPVPPLTRDDLWRGRCVTWRHVPRGGYGYVLPIPAVVWRLSGNRVTLDVSLARGGARRVTVSVSSLAETSVVDRMISQALSPAASSQREDGGGSEP